MPTNSLPRVVDGTPPSARVWELLANEVDALGWALRIVSDFPYSVNGNFAVAPNVSLTIPWTRVVAGQNLGNWVPALSPIVKVTAPGTYMMLLTVRFSYYFSGGADTTSGRRWARIMLNGTSPLSDTIGQNTRVQFNDSSNPNYPGVTVQALAVRALKPGDLLWCAFQHSSPTNIGGCLATDYGGTSFTLARLGPGPAQVPVANV